MFTAGSVFRHAMRLAPEIRNHPVDGDVVASIFNDALLELVLDAVDQDPERLAQRYTVPAWVVEQDPVDLTLAGNEEDPTTRDWLRILYIDWRNGSDEGDEVWITTIEARNRASHDYPHAVVATPEDQLRILRKVSGWDSVETLVVYGVLSPEEVTAATLDEMTFDYPRALEVALRWEVLVQLAMHRGISDARMAHWETKRDEARARLESDARTHIENRIEDQPLNIEW